jgi:hypothetical protein
MLNVLGWNRPAIEFFRKHRAYANYRGYNPVVARRAKGEPVLGSFKGSGRMRERGP